MPLDPSLFLQGAALRQQAMQQGLQNVGSGLNLYATLKNAKDDKEYKNKVLELEGAKAAISIDPDKQAYALLAKANSGQELTPDENAKLNAWQQIRGSEFVNDPYNGRVRKYDPVVIGSAPQGSPNLFNGLSEIPPTVGGYTPMYEPPGQRIDVPPVSAVNVFENATKPLPSAKPAMPALPSPKNVKQDQARYEAELDVSIAGAKKWAEMTAEQRAKAFDAAITDKKSLPIIEQMLKNNENASDSPYMDTFQPVQRVIGNKEKAKTMDLLKQDRLNLAAPLAKQLGVNPTDKDFLASLERIVNLDADKLSRKAQLENIRNQIYERNGMENPNKGSSIVEGTTATNKQTGQRIIFRNGQWMPYQ